MTTPGHPSEAEALGGQFASETDQPDRCPWTLIALRTRTRINGKHRHRWLPSRDRWFVHPRPTGVIGVIGLVLSVCGVGSRGPWRPPLGASPTTTT